MISIRIRSMLMVPSSKSFIKSRKQGICIFLMNNIFVVSVNDVIVIIILNHFIAVTAVIVVTIFLRKWWWRWWRIVVIIVINNHTAIIEITSIFFHFIRLL